VKTIVLTAAIVLAALEPVIARAEDGCSVPMAKWQPREAVERMARTHGWIVRRIKIDDGCYEIKGEDASGRDIEVKVEPGSLKVMRVKYKGNDGRGRRSALPRPRALTAP
jgi:hypothetical protein